MKLIKTEKKETVHTLELTKSECDMFRYLLINLREGGCTYLDGFNLNEYIGYFDELSRLGE